MRDPTAIGYQRIEACGWLGQMKVVSGVGWEQIILTAGWHKCRGTIGVSSHEAAREESGVSHVSADAVHVRSRSWINLRSKLYRVGEQRAHVGAVVTIDSSVRYTLQQYCLMVVRAGLCVGGSGCKSSRRGD